MHKYSLNTYFNDHLRMDHELKPAVNHDGLYSTCSAHAVGPERAATWYPISMSNGR